VSRLTPLVAILSVLVFATGCTEPPTKEMNQAQGAVDAARAAGAEQYAPSELAAAVDALQRSEAAVTQNDYRLALSLAIDSRSRAQNAAKAAVNARVKLRGDAERAVAEVETLLSHARTQLTDQRLATVPARSLREPRAMIDAVEKSMQEARAALKADDYPRAVALTKGLATRVQAALSAVEDAADGARRRRR
jgi:hypothetical protein